MRLARLASWLIDNAGVSSIKNGAEFISRLASTSWLNSSVFNLPRLIFSESSSERSDKILSPSCSADISSEKKATGAACSPVLVVVAA